MCFSLRGPLCAGEALCSLRSHVGGEVVSRGETWAPASSFRCAPLLDPTYLPCVGYANKGGSTCLPTWSFVHATVVGRVARHHTWAGWALEEE